MNGKILNKLKNGFLATVIGGAGILISTCGVGWYEAHHNAGSNPNPNPNPFGNGGGNSPQPSNPSWNQTPSPTPPASPNADANVGGKISTNGVPFYGACGNNQQDLIQSYANTGTGAAPNISVSYYELVLQPDGSYVADPVQACVSPNGDTQCSIEWFGSHAVLQCGDLGPGGGTGMFAKDGYTKTDGKPTAMVAVVSWDGSSGRRHNYLYFSDCTDESAAGCQPKAPSNIGGLN